MKIHRFIGKYNLKNKGELNISDKESVSQIRNVLKLHVGEQIILGDGELNEAVCKIRSVDRNSVAVEIMELKMNRNETGNYGILYCSILKKENFELVVQKTTELGIKEIIPIIAERTVKLNLNRERLEKIMKESAEQSGRGQLPILGEILSFYKAVEYAKDNDLNIFFDASGGLINKTEVIGKKIGIWVGPEGGWAYGEMKEVLRQTQDKFIIINLGKLILRAETAAIVGSFLINKFE